MRFSGRSAAAALLIVVALTGCSSGVSGDLAAGVAQSTSAVQTARLTLAQLRAGRIFGGVATTAFSDMLREAQDAESASAVPTGSRAERAERDQVLGVLHDATQAVLEGRSVADAEPGAPSAAAAIQRMDGVLARLKRLHDRLGSGR